MEMEKSSTQKFENICVFGGSSFGKDPEFIREACNLENFLATKKIKLVYGEKSGLMEYVVKSGLSIEGKVLEIIPKKLADVNPRGPILGDEIKVPSMHEQKATMFYNADAFIALPGGLETLEGIFFEGSSAQLNMYQKPVGLLNVNDYYDKLYIFLHDCCTHGFVKPMACALIFADKSIEELIDKMEACVPFSDPTLSKQEGGASSSRKRGIDTTLKL